MANKITNDGTKGGLLVGETDKGNGIGIKAQTPTRPVILGGGEAILKESVIKSNKKHTFDGEQMTPCEIASELNQEGGGVPIACNVDGNTSNKRGKFEGGGKIGVMSNGGSIPKKLTYIGEVGGANIGESGRLSEAKSQIASGVDAETVRKNTGWFLNPSDNKWRFEISDNEMEIIENMDDICEFMAKNSANKKLAMRLSLVIKHNKLFAAYPKLQDVKVFFIYDENLGISSANKSLQLRYNFYDEQNRLQSISSKKREILHTRGRVHPFRLDITSREGDERVSNGLHSEGKDFIRRGIIAHELQHLIQVTEGFSTGSSIEGEYEKLLKEQDIKEGSITKVEANILYETAKRRYYESFGEVEANDTDSRMELTEDERKEIEPNIKKMKDGGSIPKKLTYIGEVGGANIGESGSLSEAKSQIASGVDAETVRKNTGWFYVKEDGNWRFEVSDRDMEIIIDFDKYKKIIEANNEEMFAIQLNEVIKHDKLFKSYPELSNAYVVFVIDSKSGISKVRLSPSYHIIYNFYEESKRKSEILDVKRKSIISEYGMVQSPVLLPNSTRGAANEGVKKRTNSRNDKFRRGIIAHELQHLIQVTEGFSRGSSIGAEYRKLLKQQGLDEKAISEIQKNILLKEAKVGYHSSKGEQEANDVDFRLDLTDKERMDIPPIILKKMKDGGSIPSELQKGIQTEQEHKKTFEKLKSGQIDVKQAIEETAKDHIAENPKYYSDMDKKEKKKNDYTKKEQSLKDRVNVEKTTENFKDIRQSLDEFFTPKWVAEIMFKLAIEHGYNKGKMLEPSFGHGVFFDVAIENGVQEQNITGFEIYQPNYEFVKKKYPEATIFNHNFEYQFIEKDIFFRKNNIVKSIDFANTYYDLVVGNPPYGKHSSPHAYYFDNKLQVRYEGFFIYLSLKKLKKGGILVFIINSLWLQNGNLYNFQKEKINEIGELIDAYRLPNKIFADTDIATDIVIFRKK